MSENPNIPETLGVEEARVKEQKSKLMDLEIDSIFQGISDDPEIKKEQAETDRRTAELRGQMIVPFGSNVYRKQRGWQSALKDSFKKLFKK